VHPSGKAYQWAGEHPCDLDQLSEAEAEGISMLFEAVPTALERHGCVIGRESTAGAPGSRKRIGDPSTMAPSPQHVLDLLAATPCTEERFKDRHDIVAFLCGVKAALGDDHEEHRGDVLDWFMQHPDATDEAYFDKIWESIEDAAVGWDWLDSASGAGIGTQVDFEEHPEGQGENMPPDPGEAAVESMFSLYVYCEGMDRFINLPTGAPLTSKAFCARNTAVAQFGRSGVQSATQFSSMTRAGAGLPT